MLIIKKNNKKKFKMGFSNNYDVPSSCRKTCKKCKKDCTYNSQKCKGCNKNFHTGCIDREKKLCKSCKSCRNCDDNCMDFCNKCEKLSCNKNGEVPFTCTRCKCDLKREEDANKVREDLGILSERLEIQVCRMNSMCNYLQIESKSKIKCKVSELNIPIGKEAHSFWDDYVDKFYKFVFVNFEIDPGLQWKIRSDKRYKDRIVFTSKVS